MDILVTGGTGQLGLELQRHAWPDGVKAFFPSRAELDLSNAGNIQRAVASRPWAVVINTAAFTAVDKAESAVAEAWTLNALAPAVLAAETAKANIPLVHVSTDYVFSGDKREPYVEEDRVGPLGVYGASKEGGEQGVRSTNARHAIIRTAWVVSEHRSNFLKTMLRLARERSRLTVVADQHGCPSSARDLAVALANVAVKSRVRSLGTDRHLPSGERGRDELAWLGGRDHAARLRRTRRSARDRADPELRLSHPRETAGEFEARHRKDR